MIKIKKLDFSYTSNQPVLKDISLEIEEKTITILLGLNGSGKTTLIKLLTRLLSSPKNHIFINDKEIKDYSIKEYSKIISYVPQSISQDNDFQVIEYLVLGKVNTIKFYSSPKDEDYKQAKEIASQLGIEDLLDKKMNELSGGQRQLAVIAKAVVQDSKIIIMDEPTSSIDLRFLDMIIKYLNILKNLGKTIILSCHDPNIPLLINGNVVVLEKGKIKKYGKARDILTKEFIEDVYQCKMIETKELPFKSVSLKPIDYNE